MSINMPPDLTCAMRPKRAPIWIVAVGSAFACFLLGIFIDVNTVRFALIVTGFILLAFALAPFIKRGSGELSRARLDAVAMKLIAQDTEHTFLARSDCVVRYANPVATDRFGACIGRPLPEILSTFLANPEVLLLRLQRNAKETGASREDIVTCNGHFRLGVSLVGHDCSLWRLDDLGKVPMVASDAEKIGLPMAKVARDDTIVRSNTAWRNLLGCRPNVLSDVFADLPLRSGQTHTMHTASGEIRAMIAVTEGIAGVREVFILPGTGNEQATQSFRADWDEIEDLPVPLMKISFDGAILGSNREARQLLHIDDTAESRISDILDGLGRPINDWLREAAGGRNGHVSQFLRGRGENQDTFVQVTLNVSGNPDDHHLIAVFNDVTELKTLEAQFVQSQKMQAIGQLAGGVAHDFNNLLTAISGHCDLLLLRHDEGDQNYGDLIQIHQNANRAASLVGQLLAFSRKQNLHPEIIDLRDTLSDLMHLLNRLVGEKVTLTLKHDPALSRIKADKRQLEQVMMNLVVNARDAMPAGGEITVKTENLLLRSQMIKDRAIIPPGEYVVVRVIDTGHGIAPEKLPKIFEPFFTTKRTGEGTGLGLSTAYGIVKQTGGFIFAESEVGQGTQFSLLFPSYNLIATTPVSVPAPEVPKISSTAAGVVLLVEDEAPVRAFASRALQLRGFTVLEADCAEAALDLLVDDELQVDIFVTDVIMPGMDGPTWVQKALYQRPDTKVVFVSGYAEDAFNDDQAGIPNAVFLPKPFSLNALTQTVQQQLQSASTTD